MAKRLNVTVEASTMGKCLLAIRTIVTQSRLEYPDADHIDINCQGVDDICDDEVNISITQETCED
jgi:hypothetical protein